MFRHQPCTMQRTIRGTLPVSPATKMFFRLITSALFAGAAAGLIAALLQLAFVQPVLLHAERFESGDLVHFDVASEQSANTAAHSHDHGTGETAADGHSHDHGAAPGRHLARSR